MFNHFVRHSSLIFKQPLLTKKMTKSFLLLLKNSEKSGNFTQTRPFTSICLKNQQNLMRPLLESNLSAHLLQSQKHSVIKKFKITLHLWLSVLHRVNGLLVEYHLVLYFSMLTLVQEHIKNVSEKSLWSCVKKILL